MLATLAGSVSFHSWRFLDFEHMIFVDEPGHYAKHCSCTAILGLRKLDCPSDSGWINMVTGDVMFNHDVGEDHGMCLRPCSLDAHLIPSDLLALLAQDRDHIHASASRQPHE